jgi:hypothetical protein
MTKDNLIAFIRLVARMYEVQQEFFKGKQSVIKQARTLEHKVDIEIKSYDFNSKDVIFTWQHRFIKVVQECREVQCKYFKERTNLNLLRSKHNEGRLRESLEWLTKNFPESNIEILTQAELL